MHTHACTHMRTRTHTYTHACMHAHAHTHTHILKYKHTHSAYLLEMNICTDNTQAHPLSHSHTKLLYEGITLLTLQIVSFLFFLQM